ncbi:DUF3570 domain-containing protein [Reichenbachiella sp. MALMAid0571]|uniref:DUF3570 domain-containing protein n=1 Tax=Reichenbachiella sp. MALMAid0571 TaxID=3143939 RepID=UPI0032DEBD69
MKYFYSILFIFSSVLSFAQTESQDSSRVYKKKVLEAVEVDFLMSFYSQNGQHSAVGGGVGSEKLKDNTPTLVVNIPLGNDDVLTVDAGISAYSSASSSNVNPFYTLPVKTQSGSTIIVQTGASQTGAANLETSAAVDDVDDDPVSTGPKPIGSPWYASSGASKSDALKSLNVSYAHSSDDRNEIISVNMAVSKEYDYSSLGFGAGYTRLFNQQNTELSIKGSAYLDQWLVIYPTELNEYRLYGDDFLNSGYFNGVEVYDQDMNVTSDAYNPSAFSSMSKTNRNSYTASLSFSQVLSKNLQMSVFMDLILQSGLLSTPYQRVYFKDRPNYYIGQSSDIEYYETTKNNGVYHLADDVERLPDTRFKIPIGLRLNYYFNEIITFRTYYRYYKDDWELEAQTASIEMPIKLSQKFTFYPSYRYYTQTKADYFAPYNTHFSSEQYYTSDYDLSTFNSKSIGFGVSYTDIFTSFKIFRLALKKIDLRYQNYKRSDKLKSNIFSFGFSFVVDK